MRRRAFLAIGLLAAILGVTTLVDTAFADGCGCCCCCCINCPGQSQSSGETACLSPATVCKGQVVANCKQQFETQFLEVNMFPTACVDTPGSGTKCDKPLSNCSRTTSCIIGADGMCGTDPAANSGLWQSAIRPTTKPC